jgi:hypothetical protein
VAVSIDYLIIGGGGAGGDNGAGLGGGGGAGGLLQGTDAIATGSYGVVIGAGGAASGNDGVASTWNAHSATGGGAGAAADGNGNTGGSGGGSKGLATSGGTGTINYNGGNGTGNAGGGGGGAGAVGGTTTSLGHAASGGTGLASSLSGASVTYAGGGGGNGNLSAGTGGAGGGGNGGAGGSPGTPGTPNTGGGGGGGGYGGGSGLVIVRYQTTLGTGTGGSITTSGGGAYTIHTFTANGTFGFTVAGGGGGGGGGTPSAAIPVQLGSLTTLSSLPLPEVATDRVSDGGTRAALDQFNADLAGYLLALASALDNIALPSVTAPVWVADTTPPNFGNSTVVSTFTALGDVIFFNMAFGFGSSTNFGSGAWKFSLPAQSKYPGVIIGQAMMLQHGVAFAQGTIVVDETTTGLRVIPISGTGFVSPTVPFTWSAGDQMFLQGWYFAALS